MAAMFSALRTGRTLLPRNIIFLLLLPFLLEAEGTVQPEGLDKLKKNVFASSGIDPATFRIVA
jgi:hypothetical protein